MTFQRRGAPRVPEPASQFSRAAIVRSQQRRVYDNRDDKTWLR
jgi:hypothetical protein